ncbi:hypothetical protein [Sphingomonas sp. Leaf4]|uniref:hypothetical protein n=1 Tax=Sphingomonas sp. Leaf4 TaxID=2876553 RepID=UPI001E377522|nr:hypothetical protein [Sphingomonas sp. Leaf4]
MARHHDFVLRSGKQRFATADVETVMAPNDPSLHKSAIADQIVRGPTRADGIGHALRRSFDPKGDLPEEWQDCLRRLGRTAHH